ncbi:hypothetical protein AVEN_69391-1, partial [Araneus ventricosus]
LLSVECNAGDPIPKFRPAFSEIATSVTEHPCNEGISKQSNFKCPSYVFITSLSHHLFSLDMEGIVSPVQYPTSPPLQPNIP